MRRIILASLFIPSVLLGLGALAAESKSGSLKATLEKNIPGIKFKSVSKTPIEGLYEGVTEPSGQIIYVTLDGRYILDGDLLDRETNQNITENKRKGTRVGVLNALGEKQMVVFSPKKTKHTITVFTDTTCGYCRKLHQEMSQLNELGVKVRYMLFPRSGLSSPSYNVLQSIWCADDQQKAMNLAKSGGDITEKTCENPIKRHMEIANEFGLRGTPFIVTEKGTVINGYRPATELAALLETEFEEAK